MPTLKNPLSSCRLGSTERIAKDQPTEQVKRLYKKYDSGIYNLHSPPYQGG